MITVNIDSIVNASVVSSILVFQNSISAFEKQTFADLEDVFLNEQDFAKPIIYMHVTGETKVYNAIIDTPFENISFDESNVASSTFTLTIAEHLLIRKPIKGDTMRVNGYLYNFSYAEPDGVGIIVLYVTKG